MFSYFSREISSDVSCRQFARNVKAYYLGKKKENCRLLKYVSSYVSREKGPYDRCEQRRPGCESDFIEE